MTNSSDLRCEHCGSDVVLHFQRRSSRGGTVWRNRCSACGAEGEYVPSLREIRRACRRLRRKAGLVSVNDEQEQAFRRWEMEQSSQCEDEEEELPCNIV